MSRQHGHGPEKPPWAIAAEPEAVTGTIHNNTSPRSNWQLFPNALSRRTKTKRPTTAPEETNSLQMQLLILLQSPQMLVSATPSANRRHRAAARNMEALQLH